MALVTEAQKPLKATKHIEKQLNQSKTRPPTKMHLKAKSLVLEEGAYTLMSLLIKDYWEALSSGSVSEAVNTEQDDTTADMEPTERNLQKLFYYINEPHDEWTNNDTGEVVTVRDLNLIPTGIYKLLLQNRC